eukprot:5565959-Amphidinium_carterae.1
MGEVEGVLVRSGFTAPGLVSDLCFFEQDFALLFGIAGCEFSSGGGGARQAPASTWPPSGGVCLVRHHEN